MVKLNVMARDKFKARRGMVQNYMGCRIHP
jgi:hypothetical protein